MVSSGLPCNVTIPICILVLYYILAKIKMNWTELNALLKFEISATRNCKRVTAVCGLRFAVYLMLKVSIEQKSSYEPNVFYIIQNVINLNAASFTFNLTGWATLHFRTLLQTPNLKGQKPSSVCPFTLHQCSIVRPTRRWKLRSFDF